MTKFADALFADLMRDHGQALARLDQQVAPDRPEARESGPLAGGPRRPGPSRRRVAWLAPVAAAAGVTLAVGLAAVLGGRVHPGGHAGHANTGRRAETAYVLNLYSGTLTPISPVTGRLGEPVTVGPGAHRITIGGKHITVPRIWQNYILPDGRTDYVSYQGKHNAVLLRRVSLVTGAAGQPIRLGPAAQQIVITPDGKTAYVSYSDPGNPTGPRVVRPVSLATGTVGKPILSQRGTGQIALTPDGTTLYVLSIGHGGTVTPVATATNRPGKPIPVPAARLINFTPDGRIAMVRSISIGTGQMATPIRTATNTPGRTIKLGKPADPVAVAPDGNTIYVVHTGTSVVPVSVSTGRAGTPIEVPGAGHMVITPDGSTGYLVNVIDSRVTPVSLATGTVGTPLRVPGFPRYIVMTPDGSTAYAYSDSSGKAQTVVPISAVTGTAGRPIVIKAPQIAVLTPGAQQP
jgi:DNA-binding beta-propeller fold protein YncE